MKAKKFTPPRVPDDKLYSLTVNQSDPVEWLGILNTFYSKIKGKVYKEEIVKALELYNKNH